MERLTEIISEHPVVVIGGGVALLVLIAALRGKGGSVQTGDTPPNWTALEIAKVNANSQVAIASIGGRVAINQYATEVRLAQIQAPVALKIAQASIAADERMAAESRSLALELARINANTIAQGNNTAFNMGLMNNMFGLGASLLPWIFGSGGAAAGGAAAGGAAAGGAAAGGATAALAFL